MVSEAQKDKLEQYVELLLKWNAKINLIGKSTIDEVWHRHIEDSLQLAEHIPPETKTIIDIGSGGGLPAIPLAIITELPVHMVESDQRKCAFLRQAARELQLNCTIYSSRIEQTELKNIAQPTIITARALSELKNICNWVNSLVAKNNLQDYAILLLKGENVSRETIAAKREWNLDIEEFSSKTSQNSSIIKIKNLEVKNG